MELEQFIVDLALILVAAAVVTVLFKKINQPVVLGYIVAGFLISPNFTMLPTVAESETVTIWADIGIIFLMFALGLEFSFHNIAKVGMSAIITASVVMACMILSGYIVGGMLGWETMDRVFLGCMISMSSTMIILKAYDEMNLKNETFAQLTLGALVIEDIAGIFMMIILTAVSVSKNVSGLALAGQIGLLLLILVVMLIVGIFTVPTIINKIKDEVSDEIMLICALGFCFLMVYISTIAGFSSALGAFLAGSILAGTVMGEHIEHLVKPLKDLFGAVFFISVGMLIQPHLLIEYIGPIILVTLVVIIGQNLFATIGALASGQPLDRSMRIGFSMVQVGEFSFILASLGTSLGVTSDFLYPIIVCVSVITTFTTPIFIKNGDRAFRFLYRAMPNKFRVMLMNYTSEEQNEAEKSSDWLNYMKKYVIKFIIGTAMLLFVYTIGIGMLFPLINGIYDTGIVSNVITLAIMLVVMTPIISMIVTKKSILYNKLWLTSRANIPPLLTLRALGIADSALFLVLTLNSLFATIPTVVSVIIVAMVIVVALKSDLVKGQSTQLQSAFLANFNQKILATAKKEASEADALWVDETLYVTHFVVTKTYKRHRIKDFMASRVFGIMLFDVVKPDKSHHQIPSAMYEIEEEDILFGVGSKDAVEAYQLFLDKQDYIEIRNRRITTLKQYIEEQEKNHVAPKDRLYTVDIPVSALTEGGSGKSIADTEFNKVYSGIIVGIERNLLPIPTPKANFLLQEDDIILALGGPEMSDKLITSGILENFK